jgi:hypothetical protein
MIYANEAEPLWSCQLAEHKGDAILPLAGFHSPYSEKFVSK